MGLLVTMYPKGKFLDYQHVDIFQFSSRITCIYEIGHMGVMHGVTTQKANLGFADPFFI